MGGDLWEVARVKLKPDLYLDVDGVLLFLDKTENLWLMNLIDAGKKFGLFGKIYWLSAWTCMGTTDQLYREHPTFKRLKAKPLYWKNLKTEAIDWTRPFIWIEDGVLPEERAVFHLKAIAGQQIWEVRPGENNFPQPLP